jgi:hypothetical protein
MSEIRFADFIAALIIFLVSASDLCKDILMIFGNQHPLLFIAQIGFWLLKLLPSPLRERRYQKAMDVYIRRRKLYGAYAIIGGFSGILLSILIYLSI